MARACNSTRSPIRLGLSIVELLVALAILAVLLALIATGVQRSRDAAARADCQNRLRNQGVAIFHFESREGRLPPGSISGPFPSLNVPEGINHGLWTILLAELGQPAAAAQYRWDLNFDHAVNQPPVNCRIDVLNCPRQPADRLARWIDSKTAAVTDYAGVEGNAFLADIGVLDGSDSFDTALEVNGMVKLTEITDGASQTLLLIESAARPGYAWSSPDSLISVRFMLGGLAHSGGANGLLCDGSVRFFPHYTDLKLLGRLSTRAGGESLE